MDTDADAKFFKGSSHQPTIDEFETCFQNLRHSTTLQRSASFAISMKSL